jgi:hypothetical protein
MLVIEEHGCKVWRWLKVMRSSRWLEWLFILYNSALKHKAIKKRSKQGRYRQRDRYVETKERQHNKGFSLYFSFAQSLGRMISRESVWGKIVWEWKVLVELPTPDRLDNYLYLATSLLTSVDRPTLNPTKMRARWWPRRLKAKRGPQDRGRRRRDSYYKGELRGRWE